MTIAQKILSRFTSFRSNRRISTLLDLEKHIIGEKIYANIVGICSYYNNILLGIHESILFDVCFYIIKFTF